MPRFMGARERDAFANRLAEYAHAEQLTRCAVIFHGGEPLLLGGEQLVLFARQLRLAVGTDVELEIGLQTNGILLDIDLLHRFKDEHIAVSLSLDGPAEVNDLHRRTRRGRSSFKRAIAGLEALKAVPEVFAGVIAVIDPVVPPRMLLDFFAANDVPKLDFLLPDAHYLRPPPGRYQQPDIYEHWLLSAFDLWLDEYPSLRIRTFEALLDTVAGLPSQTDAFGFGDVSLITIETDGSYHDLDVLKIVGNDVTRITGSVCDTSIAQIARSSPIESHRRLLRMEGLSEVCQSCEVVAICGGGSLPHRYNLNGFHNPTVYCQEMRALARHARVRLEQAFAVVPQIRSDTSWDGNLFQFELAETALVDVESFWSMACASQREDFRAALKCFAVPDSGVSAAAAQMLQSTSIEVLAQRPGSIAWSRAMLLLEQGRAVHAVDGARIEHDAEYVKWLREQSGSVADGFEIHWDDAWLRRPFGKAIYFEGRAHAQRAKPVLDEALRIIEAWRPALMSEMQIICRAIQFVRDLSAHPEKIVSFSDNTVPGALFVSIYRDGQLIDPYDLADSLIHEHRHQKLYLFERIAPIVEPTSIKVSSPWRDDPRPPSGLFHAVFVFVELRRFWRHVLATGPAHLRRRAASQLENTDRNLHDAVQTLKSCPLTSTGRSLLRVLDAARVAQ